MPATALAQGTKIVVAMPSNHDDVMLEAEFESIRDMGTHVIITVVADGRTGCFLALTDGQVPEGSKFYQIYQQSGDRLIPVRFLDD